MKASSSRPTMKHLAKILNVHPSSISLALTGSREVSEATRCRVSTLAKKLHYFPSRVARSLRNSSTKTLTVILPYTSIPYYASLLDALYQETTARDHYLDVCLHEWDPAKEVLSMQQAMEHQTEGLILFPTTSSPEKLLKTTLPIGKNVPVVLIGSTYSRPSGRYVRACIGTDISMGTYFLGKHLLEMNHRQIALFLPGLPNRLNSRKRITAMNRAIKDYPDAKLYPVYSDLPLRPMDKNSSLGGIPVSSLFLHFDQLAERFLLLNPRPTAIIATDDITAHVILGVLQKNGLSVPKDLSLASFGGSFLSKYGSVPLTCAEVPTQDIARQAVEILLTPQEKWPLKAKAEMRLIVPRIVYRASVAKLLS